MLGEYVDTEYKIKINLKYYNFIDINLNQIYNEVSQYKNKLQTKYKLACLIETDYVYHGYLINNKNFTIMKIILKFDDYIFSGQNYIECNKKIIEYIKENEVKLKEKLEIKLKEEQEKIKLKYGDKTVLTIYRHLTNIDLLIFNVDIDFINLLDIIHYNLGKIIVDGFIKQTNCVNYEKYFNKSIKYFSDKEKHIFNITIHNCPNLKIINNIIHFEYNCYLKIVNCPKLEFIQNYNNFSEIYIDNHLVKIVNE